MFELVPFNRRRNQIQEQKRDIFDFDRLINGFSVIPSSLRIFRKAAK